MIISRNIYKWGCKNKYMNPDKRRRKLIEQGVAHGLSDADIVERARNLLKETYTPHDIFKLRRELNLLSEDEKATLQRDRRNFLIGAAGAGIALIGGLAYKLFLGEDSSQWAFIQRAPVPLENANWKQIEKLYVPVGPERTLSQNNPRFQATKESLTDALIHKGIRESGMPDVKHYELTVKERYFMVPDEPVIAQSVLRYCAEATDYLYSHPELCQHN